MLAQNITSTLLPSQLPAQDSTSTPTTPAIEPSGNDDESSSSDDSDNTNGNGDDDSGDDSDSQQDTSSSDDDDSGDDSDSQQDTSSRTTMIVAMIVTHQWGTSSSDEES